jgi:hypothetical protein
MTVHHAKAIDPSGFKPKPAQALRFFIPALLYQQIGEALADIVVSGVDTSAQPSRSPRSASDPPAPATRSGSADDHPGPQRTSGQFRSLDA